MKVAIVYPIPFGKEGSFGGGERYAFELARALSRFVDARLVTIGKRRSTQQMDGLRIETHPYLRLVEGTRSNPLALGFLRSLADVDVVHCTSYSTLITDLSVLYARACRKRVFITDIGGGGYISLRRILNVAKLSHGLLLLSRFAERFFPPGPPSRRVVYGGVDVDRFGPADGPRGRSVLYVGRLLPHKGIDFLIRAVPPGVPLRIVGRWHAPAYAAELVELARGKDVTFVDSADDQRLIDEYRRAAVCVLPSVYRDVRGALTAGPELLGLAVLEAMACAVPVVCTEVGSMPEIVEDGITGYVVPPNDPVALWDRIGALLEDPAQAARMGAAARQGIVARFTWEAVARRCLDAYAGTSADTGLEVAA